MYAYLTQMKLTRYLPVLLILALFGHCAGAQTLTDTLAGNSNDTSLTASGYTIKARADTTAVMAPAIIKSYSTVVNALLSSNKFINVKEAAVYFIADKKQ